MTRLSAGLLLLAAAGCQPGDPSGSVPASSRGEGVVELLRPAEWAETAGSRVRELLEGEGKNLCRLESGPVSGIQSGFDFSAPPLQFEIVLAGLEFQARAEGWHAALDIEVSDPCGTIEFNNGNETFSCQYLLSVPARACSVDVRPDAEGGAALVAIAGAGCTGEPATLALDPYCSLPAQDQLLGAIDGLLHGVLEQGTIHLGGWAAEALGGALGLSCAESLAFAAGPQSGGHLQAVLDPQGRSPELGELGGRVDIQGGFWSEPAPECLPADPGDLAGENLAAVDAAQVWQAGASPGMLALVVSDGLLEQALRAAFRAGALCRTACAEEQAGSALADEFPSLQAYLPQAERRLVLAAAPPTLEVQADEQNVGLLLKTHWPRVRLDFYTECFGGWCRALGVETAVRLDFRAILDGGLLSAELDGVSLENLQITFSKALVEQGSDLQQAALTVTESALRELIGERFSLPVDLPPGAGPAAAIGRLDRRTVFYLDP